MVDAQLGLKATTDLPQVLQAIDQALDLLIQKTTQAGTSFATLGTSSSGVATGLTTIRTGLQQVDQSLATTTASITKYNSSGQALAQTNSTLNQSFTATTAGFKQQGDAFQFLNDQVIANSKSQATFGSTLKDNVLGIGLAASGITGIIGQFTSLERAQLSLDKSQTKLLGSSITLEKATQKLQKIQADSASTAEQIATQEDVVAKAYQAHEDALNTVNQTDYV